MALAMACRASGLSFEALDGLDQDLPEARRVVRQVLGGELGEIVLVEVLGGVLDEAVEGGLVPPRLHEELVDVVGVLVEHPQDGLEVLLAVVAGVERLREHRLLRPHPTGGAGEQGEHTEPTGAHSALHGSQVSVAVVSIWVRGLSDVSSMRVVVR